MQIRVTDALAEMYGKHPETSTTSGIYRGINKIPNSLYSSSSTNTVGFFIVAVSKQEFQYSTREVRVSVLSVIQVPADKINY